MSQLDHTKQALLDTLNHPQEFATLQQEVVNLMWKINGKIQQLLSDTFYVFERKILETRLIESTSHGYDYHNLPDSINQLIRSHLSQLESMLPEQAKEALCQRMWKEYLEWAVLASIDDHHQFQNYKKYNLQKPPKASDQLQLIYTGQNTISQMSDKELYRFKEDLARLVGLIFIGDDFHELRFKVLNEIFQSLKLIRSLTFVNNQLSRLSVWELQQLFSHLESVRLIQFGRSNIMQMTPEQFQAIFSNLSGLYSLWLNSFDLDKISKEGMEAIFWHLPLLQSLDISNSKLHNISQENLHILSPCLQKLTNLHLAYTLFQKISPEALEIIFSQQNHLKGLEIDVDLLRISPSLLSMVAKRLKKLKKLTISNEISLDENIPEKWELFFSEISELQHFVSYISYEHMPLKVIEILFTHLKNITKLQLINEDAFNLSKEKLLAMFSPFTALRSFQCGYNFENIEMSQIAIIATIFPQLQELDLSKSTLSKTSEISTYLAKSIAHIPQIILPEMVSTFDAHQVEDFFGYIPLEHITIVTNEAQHIQERLKYFPKKYQSLRISEGLSNM